MGDLTPSLLQESKLKMKNFVTIFPKRGLSAKRHESEGAWVAQWVGLGWVGLGWVGLGWVGLGLVERPTLGFGSGHDLVVMGSSPMSLLRILSLPLSRLCVLSPSKNKNKLKKKERHEREKRALLLVSN